jgi:YidC/Oxa1 family membrane protein insertase
VIAVAWWQGLLDGLGWFLAKLYDLIPSYGVAIILFTVLIRMVLLPLQMKQLRSMQAMGAVAPKLRAIQQKYKGNRQKQMEEQQKLYREEGINPLAGCWPMLLQLPVLFALFSVLRFPAGLDHLPQDSQLYQNIRVQKGINFVGTNLVCSAVQAGTQVDLTDPKSHKPPISPKTGKRYVDTNRLDCGHGVPVRIPYYVLAVLMVGTTYYSSRQMQRMNPVGSQQQQTLTRLMPLLFGVWGFLFPAGLVLYWTTSNLAQIGVQQLMLRAEKKAEAASGDGRGRPSPKKPAKRSRFAEWMERAQQSGQARRQQGGSKGGSAASDTKGDGQSGSTKSGSSQAGAGGSRPGSTRSGSGRGSTQRSSGGRSAGSRKKRRKR